VRNFGLLFLIEGEIEELVDGLPHVVCDVVRDAVIGDGEKAGVLARFVDEMGDALLGLWVTLFECREVDEWRGLKCHVPNGS